MDANDVAQISLIAAAPVVPAMGIAGILERAPPTVIPFFGNGTRTPAGQYITATLDMKGRSKVRGAEGPATASEFTKASARESEPDDHFAATSFLAIIAIASEPGRYAVEILREIGKPLHSASGDAHIENGLTLLTVKLDLVNLPSGEYLIGIRRVPCDWAFHLIVIE